jgi:putative endonuclease
MTQKSQQRVERYRFGLWAEWLCRLSLRLRGYQIRATRYRTAAGEIDIIASRADVVAIIEVKARRDALAAALALGAGQRVRIVRATRLVLARWPQLQNSHVRFDVMLVTPWHWPQHIINAWGEI